MITRGCRLDPIYVHTSSCVELVIELFLLALVISDDSGVNRHLGVCSCGTTLRQCTRVDDEYAVDDLSRDCDKHDTLP